MCRNSVSSSIGNDTEVKERVSVEIARVFMGFMCLKHNVFRNCVANTIIIVPSLMCALREKFVM